MQLLVMCILGPVSNNKRGKNDSRINQQQKSLLSLVLVWLN